MQEKLVNFANNILKEESCVGLKAQVNVVTNGKKEVSVGLSHASEKV